MTATITRSPSAWLETHQIRALLKANLGLNASKVSVSAKNGNQYVKVTVRDASVDLVALRQFVRSLDTWNMGLDDVVTGQSISIHTTSEVDAAHAAPFLAEIPEIVERLRSGHSWTTASNGAVISILHSRLSVSAEGRFERHDGGYFPTLDESSYPYLALAIARAV